MAGTAGEGPTVNVTDMKHLIDAWINVSKSLNLSVIIQLGGRPLPDVQKLVIRAFVPGILSFYFSKLLRSDQISKILILFSWK